MTVPERQWKLRSGTIVSLKTDGGNFAEAAILDLSLGRRLDSRRVSLSRFDPRRWLEWRFLGNLWRYGKACICCGEYIVGLRISAYLLPRSW